MSVVGMLALSFLFYSKLKTPKVFPYAYADNWSFMSTSERSCFQSIQHILNLVAALRMQIDFSKSWCWATTKLFKTFWSDAAILLLEQGFKFKIKSHVHDLGCTISYTDAVVLGPLRDKIDNAVAKCNRLKRLQLALEERAEKIQVAIWPAVFYGALGVAIGNRHFVTLRRAASNVLVGDHKYAASSIAMHYLSDRVQDPLLYLINDMLTTLRRFFVYHPDMAEQILQSIRAYDGKVRGPATAIASYLAHCGWELTSQATLVGPGGLRVNLKTSSNKQIKQQLRIAWDWFCHQEVQHRKGVTDQPFDSFTTVKLMQQLTDRQRRILALSLTSGWQSYGAIAQWSTTQDPQCPWCHQHDTHRHQLLECPAFADLRTKHPTAVQYLSQNRYLCWFPLPTHHEHMPLARQAMFLRNTTVSSVSNISTSNDMTLYTDGSCDDTRDPFTARAAWAVVLSNSIPNQPGVRTFHVVATGHCPGLQTINRSELYAMIIAVETTLTVTLTHSILFVTDSQYVISIIYRIHNGTIMRHPHKTSHWDLVHRLIQIWDGNRFTVQKIKSHLQLDMATSQQELWHIHGNACADEAAGKSRQLDDEEFSTLCQQVRLHRTQQQKNLTLVYHYLLDFACERMHKLETKTHDPQDSQASGVSRNTEAAFQTTLRTLKTWMPKVPFFPTPPEPHRVVFWCSPWGVNLTRMVWAFSTLLRWPDPSQAHDPRDLGISWTELACSFMLWSNRVLPIRLKIHDKLVTTPYTDPRVQILPIKARSLRILADNFRWIVKHIQTFAKAKIIPTYKKQGTSSLTRLGFATYHQGGISRRPTLPNATDTNAFLENLILHMPTDPPYHNEIQIPALPENHLAPRWPDWEEVIPAKQEKFLQNVRNALFRKIPFDDIKHPNNS